MPATDNDNVFIVIWQSDDYQWNAQVHRSAEGAARFFGGDSPEQTEAIREACRQAEADPGEVFEPEWADWITIRYASILG